MIRGLHQHAAILLALLPCAASLAGVPVAEQPDATAAQVVTITGGVVSTVRDYARFSPGIKEFNQHRALAPDAPLRFGLVGNAFPMKPVYPTKATLEAGGGFFSEPWSQELTIVDKGWFLIPESPEAERRKARVNITMRRAYNAGWVIDVHTPSLPAHAYRLGDLRMECRVYLAIEWEIWHGALLMGQRTKGVDTPPMDRLCEGQRSIFFNTRPWPSLKAYVLKEGTRTQRHALDGQKIAVDSLMLQLQNEGDEQPWSNEALVEFEFEDPALRPE